MRSISIHKARELPGSVRAAVEILLGRALEADEEVSVRAFPQHEAPSGEERAAFARGLQERMSKTAERVRDVPEEQLDQTHDEALKHVHPTYGKRQ